MSQSAFIAALTCTQAGTLPSWAVQVSIHSERGVYEDYFNAAHWVAQSKRLANQAFALACRYGLTAVDAPHVAAAASAGADEFITGARPTSPRARVTELRILNTYRRPL